MMLSLFVVIAGIMFTFIIWFFFIHVSIEGIVPGPRDEKNRLTWIAICRRGTQTFEVRSDGNTDYFYRDWFTSKKPVSTSMRKKLEGALRAQLVFSLKESE